jgi:hypothetical protein
MLPRSKESSRGDADRELTTRREFSLLVIVVKIFELSFSLVWLHGLSWADGRDTQY